VPRSMPMCLDGAGTWSAGGPFDRRGQVPYQSSTCQVFCRLELTLTRPRQHHSNHVSFLLQAIIPSALRARVTRVVRWRWRWSRLFNLRSQSRCVSGQSGGAIHAPSLPGSNGIPARDNTLATKLLNSSASARARRSAPSSSTSSSAKRSRGPIGRTSRMTRSRRWRFGWSAIRFHWKA
jgi:hypothetical protein